MGCSVSKQQIKQKIKYPFLSDRQPVGIQSQIPHKKQPIHSEPSAAHKSEYQPVNLAIDIEKYKAKPVTQVLRPEEKQRVKPLDRPQIPVFVSVLPQPQTLQLAKKQSVKQPVQPLPLQLKQPLPQQQPVEIPQKQPLLIAQNQPQKVPQKQPIPVEQKQEPKQPLPQAAQLSKKQSSKPLPQTSQLSKKQSSKPVQLSKLESSKLESGKPPQLTKRQSATSILASRLTEPKPPLKVINQSPKPNEDEVDGTQWQPYKAVVPPPSIRGINKSALPDFDPATKKTSYSRTALKRGQIQISLFKSKSKINASSINVSVE